MVDEKVTLLVEAEDAASNVIKGIGSAVVVFNQGLEIAKKGLETFNKVIVENFKAMVEYRGENDAVAKRLRELGNEGLWLKAQVFDVLTPIVLGLGEAFNRTGNGIRDYINTNRQLIATNITVWLADVARILVTGVAEGLLWSSRAVSGLIEAWNLLSSGVETAIGGMLSGISSLLSAVSRAVEVTGGPEGLSGAIASAAKNAEDLGSVFSESSNESLAAVDAQIAKQQELEDSIRSVKETATNFIDKSEIIVLDEIEKGWGRVNKQIEKAIDNTNNQQAAFSSLEPTISQLYERKAALQEKDAAWIENQTKANKAMQISSANTIANAVGQVGAAWTAVGVAMIQSSKDTAKAVISAVLDSAVIAITAAATMAAAKAFAANQDFPIVGVAIGLAAASAAAGIGKAFLSQLPAAADGGQIFGGIPGQDSVGTLVQHGEGVLKQGQTAVLQRVANLLEGMENKGGMVPAMAGGGGTSIVNFNSIAPPTSADAMKAQRAMMKQQDRAKRLRRG